jgi:DNA-binding FadR family transcriptional regulator
MTFSLSGKSVIQKPKNLADQVVDFIMQEIQKGVLRPGDFLPPENELTELFGVSRAVVREALAILKSQRVIETKQGGRTRITEGQKLQPFDLPDDSSSENINIGYLYELRAALEGEASELAALRATPDKIANLKNRLDALEEAVSKGESGTIENVEFHKAITEASGNPYFISFLKWLDNRIRDQIQAGRNKTKKQGLPRSVQDEHIAIFEAIRDKNVTKARASVLKHLKNAAKDRGINIHTEQGCDAD